MPATADFNTKNGNEKLAVSIDEASQIIGLSRSFLYQQVVLGALRTVRAGDRRLIRISELRRYLDGNEQRLRKAEERQRKLEATARRREEEAVRREAA